MTTNSKPRVRIYNGFGVDDHTVFNRLKDVTQKIRDFQKEIWKEQENGKWDPADFEKYVLDTIALEFSVSRVRAAAGERRRKEIANGQAS